MRRIRRRALHGPRFAHLSGRGTRRRLAVCLGALLVAAALFGARALTVTGHARVAVVAAADDDAQVPPDYMSTRALGGAETVTRAMLRRAAAQALALGSAGGAGEDGGANNLRGRVTGGVVGPPPAGPVLV